MVILHNFHVELEEYSERGLDNEFPVLERCPDCHCVSQGNVHRNGYYWRYGVNEKEMAFLIPICRFKCLACKVNISVLPSFLIPYYQHTIYTIVGRVHQFLEGEKVLGYRQQLKQHVDRFCRNIHWIHSFFADAGHRLGLSDSIKKEALKYVKMIRDLGESTFFRRSCGHLSSYFMGRLIVPYSKRDLGRVIINDCPT